ncbi:hypothetical protein LXL04_005222 [Taraxacum kok-saghyz]
MKKISPASARSHTRNISKPDSSAGILKKFVTLFFVGLSAWAYQTAFPPPPRTVGSPGGLPITSPRLKLRDGRHLSYIEFGVPKEEAKYKLIFIHGFNLNKFHNPFAATASPDLVKELGVYFVAIDRPGYGESDPDPKRTVKSLPFDIEELADHLNLGPKFYIAGYSMGGQVAWSCLKYIPHRLAGAVLIAPGINYWWPNLPSNLTNDVFSRQLPQDRWSLRVAYYLPWLTYWWNSQKWFPSFSFIDEVHLALSPSDMAVASKLFSAMDPYQMQAWHTQPRQQGDFESLHRDLNIGFGKWDFDPMDIKNPFPNNNGSVHIWQGDEDLIVPVTPQRYIANQLPWVKYHELTGIGHLLAFADGVIDSILKELFINN